MKIIKYRHVKQVEKKAWICTFFFQAQRFRFCFARLNFVLFHFFWKTNYFEKYGTPRNIQLISLEILLNVEQLFIILQRCEHGPLDSEGRLKQWIKKNSLVHIMNIVKDT
jgi:hypothetical protein